VRSTVNRRLIAAASAVLLGLVLRAPAQVTLGENLNMNLNGSLSFGYTADYGNLNTSDHGITAGGTADLSGSYYSPNFLSFHIQPFYNQSRVNSNFQSISDSSGVTASAGIFSGSHFPGSVSYSKTYNSEGNFALPGVANYTTHGNGDVFSAGWASTFPIAPRFRSVSRKATTTTRFTERMPKVARISTLSRRPPRTCSPDST